MPNIRYQYHLCTNLSVPPSCTQCVNKLLNEDIIMCSASTTNYSPLILTCNFPHRPPSITNRSAEVVPHIQRSRAALRARTTIHPVPTASQGYSATTVTRQTAATCHTTGVSVTAEGATVAHCGKGHQLLDMKLSLNIVG